VLQTGLSVEMATAAAILVHGRGASAEDILTLTRELNQPGFAYLAPQAAGNTWYPYSFLAPLEQNEPGLSSGLSVIDHLVMEISKQGIPPRRVLLLGFSQGACLALEYAARNPRRFGGLVGLTGGLIGPPGTDRDYEGSLSGSSVFLGAGDPDPHVPWSRVEETAAVFERMGAEVDLRRYPGMGHSISREQIATVRQLMESLLKDDTDSSGEIGATHGGNVHTPGPDS